MKVDSFDLFEICKVRKGFLKKVTDGYGMSIMDGNFQGRGRLLKVKYSSFFNGDVDHVRKSCFFNE